MMAGIDVLGELPLTDEELRQRAAAEQAQAAALPVTTPGAPPIAPTPIVPAAAPPAPVSQTPPEVSVPLSVPPPSQTMPMPTGGGTRTTVKKSEKRDSLAPTAETPVIAAEQAALDKKEEAQVASETAAAKRKAEAVANTADITAAQVRVNNAERALKEHDLQTEVDRRKLIANDDETRSRQMLQDFHNPKNGFYATRTTPQKIAGGLALLFGLFGGAKDGSNVGADAIEKAAAEDTERRRQQVTDQLALVTRSGANVATAENNMKRELENIDLRHATLLDATVAEGQARLKRQGVPDAEIEGNKGLLKLQQKALDLRAAHDQKLWQKVETDYDQVQLSGAGVGGHGGRGGAGGKDTRLKPSSQDLTSVEGLTSAITGLKTISQGIEQTPVDWNEYYKNNMSWRRSENAEKLPAGKQIRALGQWAGAFDTAAEQGLKSEGAKNIHRQIVGLREAIAKAKGGVITDSDRTGAESELALAAVSEPAMALRLLARVRTRMEKNLKLLVTNRQLTIPPEMMTSAAPLAAPAGMPRSPGTGAIRRTSKSKGPGWEFNGQFYPDNESTIKL